MYERCETVVLYRSHKANQLWTSLSTSLVIWAPSHCAKGEYEFVLHLNITIGDEVNFRLLKSIHTE